MVFMMYRFLSFSKKTDAAHTIKIQRKTKNGKRVDAYVEINLVSRPLRQHQARCTYMFFVINVFSVAGTECVVMAAALFLHLVG